MTPADLLGARMAVWWCDRYTRSADAAVGEDRREELWADVQDQIALDNNAGTGRGAMSRAVLGRALRGVPADLVWRLETEWVRDRFRSLLSQPETVLGGLFLALVPITAAGDVARSSDMEPATKQLVSLSCVLLYTVAVAYALSRMRVVPPRRWVRALTGHQLARGLHLAMYSSFALSGIWRFAPGPWSRVSFWAWVAFGVTLLANAALLLTRLIIVVLRRAGHQSLDLRKVPS